MSVKYSKFNILLIEGKRADKPTFGFGLVRKGFQVDTVANGSAALDYLSANTPHLVLVNAASMRTSGKRICQSIRKQYPNLPVVLVVEAGGEVFDTLDADVVLTLPFTLQKLLNRLRPYLPVEDKDALKVGPLTLDVEQRRLKIDDRQVSLTPRLVILLKSLMDHPGEVVGREDLFRTVWETAYIGDTRTLDVHVSWLRQAMEDDPRHPQYIKTVRGVGYRLDVDSITNNHKNKKSGS
ncbi:MAG: response regulator transcription factor [Anaerolineae bacterium]|nr:response regulator transcription factor [Anaerolineae bacterium]